MSARAFLLTLVLGVSVAAQPPQPPPPAPIDPAPNDETHHRLPDGTVLHVSIWTHRFGGQIDRRFVQQPERSGWTQVLTAPVPPAPALRK